MTLIFRPFQSTGPFLLILADNQKSIQHYVNPMAQKYQGEKGPQDLHAPLYAIACSDWSFFADPGLTLKGVPLRER